MCRISTILNSYIVSLFIIVLPFCGCSQNVKSGSITYLEKVSITEEGVSFFDKIEDSLLTIYTDRMEKEGMEKDSIEQNRKDLKKMISFVDFLSGDSLQNGRKIKFNADSIMIHSFRGDKMKGDFYIYNLIENKRYNRSKYDSITIMGNRKFDFNGFKKAEGYTVKIDKKDKKRIHGLKCFKLIATIEEETSEEIEFIDFSGGQTVYEMYVTRKIKLPTFFFEGKSEMIEDYFPLEVKITHSKMPGVIERYWVKELIKK